MVNSESFGSDGNCQAKDCISQPNNGTDSSQSPSPVTASAACLRGSDFTMQMESLPLAHAIEPTASKTEFNSTPTKLFLNEEDGPVIPNSEGVILERDSGLKEDKETCINGEGEASIENESKSNLFVSATKVQQQVTTPEDEQKSKKVSKKLLCLYCERTFVTPNLRQKHVDRCHSVKQNRRASSRFQNQQTTTACSFCSNLSNKEHSLQELFEHLTKEHSTKYFGCLECEERFLNKISLEEHNTTTHNKPGSRTLFSEEGNNQDEVQSLENECAILNSSDNKSDKTPKSKNRSRVSADLSTDMFDSSSRDSSRLQEDSSTNDSVERMLRKRTTPRPKHIPVKVLKTKKVSVKSTKLQNMKRTTRLQTTKEVETKPAKKPKGKLAKTKTEPPPVNKVEKQPVAQKNSFFSMEKIFTYKKITDHSIDNLKISSLTFDDVFDKAFFNRMNSNIRDNLLNHIDGKLFKNKESESRISNFEKTDNIQGNLTENFGCEVSLNATTPVPSSLPSNQVEDVELQLEYGTKPSKKKPPVTNDEVHYKYFTRRKYQASLKANNENRDLSKLDMWTQMAVKNRQQKDMDTKKSDKEMQDYNNGEEYKTKLRVEELNRILDKRGPFEDLKEEANKKAALDKMNECDGCEEINTEVFTEVRSLLTELIDKVEIDVGSGIKQEPIDESDPPNMMDTNVANFLCLRRVTSLVDEPDVDKSDKITLICSSQETENFEASVTPRDKNTLVNLSGEWTRSRIYICAACGFKLPNMKFLMDHKNLIHPNVVVQHYEFVGNQNALYRHLSIPGLGKVGDVEDNPKCKQWKRSEARTCTKCQKQCNTLGELHRHILECGEDWSWMFCRKKCKYKPFGSKSRRKRRGLIKRILPQKSQDEPQQEKKKTSKKVEGPRQKPSDAETIQRMLANLPAKRATRKIMCLKDGFQRTKKTPVPSSSSGQTSTSGLKSMKKTSQLTIKQRNKAAMVENTVSGEVKVRRKYSERNSKCNPALLRKSYRNLNKVFASKILDTNSSLATKRKLKSAISNTDVSVSEEVESETPEAETETTEVVEEKLPEKLPEEKTSFIKTIMQKTVKRKKATAKKIVGSSEEGSTVNLPSSKLKKIIEEPELDVAATPADEKQESSKTQIKKIGKKILRKLSMRKKKTDDDNKKVKTESVDVEVESAVQPVQEENSEKQEKEVVNRKRKIKTSFKNVVKKMKLGKSDKNKEEQGPFLEVPNTEPPPEIQQGDKEENLAIKSDAALCVAKEDNKEEIEQLPMPEKVDENTPTIESTHTQENLDNIDQNFDKSISLVENAMKVCLTKEINLLSVEKDQTTPIDLSTHDTVDSSQNTSNPISSIKFPIVDSKVKNKIAKRSKGLNDCIAMLTSKLQQKSDLPELQEVPEKEKETLKSNCNTNEIVETVVVVKPKVVEKPPVVVLNIPCIEKPIIDEKIKCFIENKPPVLKVPQILPAPESVHQDKEIKEIKPAIEAEITKPHLSTPIPEPSPVASVEIEDIIEIEESLKHDRIHEDSPEFYIASKPEIKNNHIEPLVIKKKVKPNANTCFEIKTQSTNEASSENELSVNKKKSKCKKSKRSDSSASSEDIGLATVLNSQKILLECAGILEEVARMKSKSKKSHDSSKSQRHEKDLSSVDESFNDSGVALNESITTKKSKTNRKSKSKKHELSESIENENSFIDESEIDTKKSKKNKVKTPVEENLIALEDNLEENKIQALEISEEKDVKKKQKQRKVSNNSQQVIIDDLNKPFEESLSVTKNTDFSAQKIMDIKATVEEPIINEVKEINCVLKIPVPETVLQESIPPPIKETKSKGKKKKQQIPSSETINVVDSSTAIKGPKSKCDDITEVVNNTESSSSIDQSSKLKSKKIGKTTSDINEIVVEPTKKDEQNLTINGQNILEKEEKSINPIAIPVKSIKSKSRKTANEEMENAIENSFQEQESTKTPEVNIVVKIKKTKPVEEGPVVEISDDINDIKLKQKKHKQTSPSLSKDVDDANHNQNQKKEDLTVDLIEPSEVLDNKQQKKCEDNKMFTDSSDEHLIEENELKDPSEDLKQKKGKKHKSKKILPKISSSIFKNAFKKTKSKKNKELLAIQGEVVKKSDPPTPKTKPIIAPSKLNIISFDTSKMSATKLNTETTSSATSLPKLDGDFFGAFKNLSPPLSMNLYTDKMPFSLFNKPPSYEFSPFKYGSMPTSELFSSKTFTDKVNPVNEGSEVPKLAEEVPESKNSELPIADEKKNGLFESTEEITNAKPLDSDMQIGETVPSKVNGKKIDLLNDLPNEGTARVFENDCTQSPNNNKLNNSINKKKKSDESKRKNRNTPKRKIGSIRQKKTNNIQNEEFNTNENSELENLTPDIFTSNNKLDECFIETKTVNSKLETKNEIVTSVEAPLIEKLSKSQAKRKRKIGQKRTLVRNTNFVFAVPIQHTNENNAIPEDTNSNKTILPEIANNVQQQQQKPLIDFIEDNVDSKQLEKLDTNDDNNSKIDEVKTDSEDEIPLSLFVKTSESTKDSIFSFQQENSGTISNSNNVSKNTVNPVEDFDKEIADVFSFLPNDNSLSNSTLTSAKKGTPLSEAMSTRTSVSIFEERRFSPEVVGEKELKIRNAIKQSNAVLNIDSKSSTPLPSPINNVNDGNSSDDMEIEELNIDTPIKVTQLPIKENSSNEITSPNLIIAAFSPAQNIFAYDNDDLDKSDKETTTDKNDNDNDKDGVLNEDLPTKRSTRTRKSIVNQYTEIGEDDDFLFAKKPKSPQVLSPTIQQQADEVQASTEEKNTTSKNTTTTRKGSKQKGNKGSPKKKPNNKGEVSLDTYCEICNKNFARNDNLLKHKMTFTHIAKLSELEAKEAAEKLKQKELEEKNLIEDQDKDYSDEAAVATAAPAPIVSEDGLNEDTGLPKDYDIDINLSNILQNSEVPKNILVPNLLKTGNDSMKLADIINDVLNKPVTSVSSFSEGNTNSVSTVVGEVKRYKSLGERKSFDSDTNVNSALRFSPTENVDVPNTDFILQKQISLLENIIEENKASFQYIEENSNNSNKSFGRNTPLSELSETKMSDVTFRPNGDNNAHKEITTNESNSFVKPMQYEEISEDSTNLKAHFEENRARKALNRDEELFLECCSLLKSSSEISNYSKRSNRVSAPIKDSFTFKPVDEPDWFEQKKVEEPRNKQQFLDNLNCDESDVSRMYTPLGEGFADDYSNSNTVSQEWPLKTNSESQRKSESKDTTFNNILKFGKEENQDNIDGEFSSNEDRCSDTKEQQSVESIFTSSSDTYDKKMLTKGAMKVFEGLKVSIPTDELNMNEVLNCSPSSKRPESDSDKKLQSTPLIEKLKSSSSKTMDKPKFKDVKDTFKKFGNKLGLKVTKKKTNTKTKSKSYEEEKKTFDVYDFEETQDNTDVFSKDTLPDLRTFRSQVQEKRVEPELSSQKLGQSESDSESNRYVDSFSFEAQSLSSYSSQSSSSLKDTTTAKQLTKNKCMIMGRIFKNAIKAKQDDSNKNISATISAAEQSDSVDSFVNNKNSPTIKENENKKKRLTDQEMNVLFDKLLEDTPKNKHEFIAPLPQSTKSPAKKLNSKKLDAAITKSLSKARTKFAKTRKRPKHDDSSDDEFNIGKPQRKRSNKKNKEDDGINLEQELKECIGVASRKSQRKCTSGKQNVLIEFWSSDESNFDAILEAVSESKSKSKKLPTVNKTIDEDEDLDKDLDDLPMEKSLITIDEEVKVKPVEPRKEKEKSKPVRRKSNSKHKHNKQDKRPRKSAPKMDSDSLVSSRQKRSACDTLYYWSSSSEDDFQDLIEVKPIRDEPDDDDRPVQHGWIVGDSPKKLVTMLAQAKGKKVDAVSVKEQSKKRTSV